MDLDELLRDVDPDEVSRLYGEAAGELLEVALRDGHFADCDPTDITWPAGDDLARHPRTGKLAPHLREQPEKPRPRRGHAGSGIPIDLLNWLADF